MTHVPVTPLDPQPAYGGITRFVRIPDPWHADAFKGTPGEGVVESSGPRKMVWAAEDWCGNIVGILDQATADESLTIEDVPGLGWCWVAPLESPTGAGATP